LVLSRAGCAAGFDGLWKVEIRGNSSSAFEPCKGDDVFRALHDSTSAAAIASWRFGPGGRTHNGTVDHLPRRPTLENHFSRRRLARQEITSAPVLGARCQPACTLAVENRVSCCRRRCCRGDGLIERAFRSATGRQWTFIAAGQATAMACSPVSGSPCPIGNWGSPMESSVRVRRASPREHRLDVGWKGFHRCKGLAEACAPATPECVRGPQPFQYRVSQVSPC